MVDGFNQVIQIPGDRNPDPRGLEASHAQPKGGLRYYQDDVDTKKEDVASEEIGDDPSTRRVQEPGHLKVLNPEDLRETVEDSDEADKDYY
jgi:hypothetical protein